MERQRSRRNSISSVHSQSNSAIANFQCSEEHTHAIVQREKDNKVILVPLEYFINFGKTVKVNQTATFKSNVDSRKSDRGKVLLFGNEELCVEQLQVLQEEETVEEDQVPEKKTNKTNAVLTTSNKINQEKSMMEMKNKSNSQVQKKSKQNYMMNVSRTAPGRSKINEINDLFDSLSPKKINTASSITIGPSMREKKTSQVQRKLFDENNEILSTDEPGFEEDEIYESTNCSTKETFDDVVVTNLSVKRTTDVNNQVVRKNLTSTSLSSQKQSESVLKQINHQDVSSESSTDEEETDESAFVSKTKHYKLQRKYLKSKNKILALEKKINYMKKNYVPMPDMRARPWFVTVAKRFTEQLLATDVCTHAELIGGLNPNQLLACVENRGTATTRQIIRALYSNEEMLDKSGKETVSVTRREAIRNFVELHNGCLPDRQFNEAINGVFRQAKSTKRRAERSTLEPPPKKIKPVKGQQTIDKMISSKKPTSSVAKKIPAISNNAIFDVDDD